jgi:ssDNA-binding Zn-finger/Zn-ribbon topoisomerase 1
MQVAQGSTKASTSARTAARSASSRTCVPTRRERRPTPSNAAREHITAALRRRVRPEASPTSSSRRRTRRTRTRPSARRRSISPRAVEAPQGRAVQALQADLEPLRREPDEPAVYDQTSADIEAKAPGRRRRTASAQRARAQVRRLARGVRATRVSREARRRGLAGEARPRRKAPTDADGSERRTPIPAESETRRSPSSTRGSARLVDAAGRRDRAEVHAAARRATRRLARARARRARHRPPEHVRRDHQQGAGARLRREGRRRAQFRPTTLGKFVVDGLVKSELDFMDPAFTSKMEEELDEVEAGSEERVEAPVALLQALPRAARRKARRGSAGTPSRSRPTRSATATECGTGKMLKRWSKNGWFLGCANYPEVQEHARPRADGNGPLAPTAQPRETGIVCDKCGKPMVIKTGRYGEFLSCTGYPSARTRAPCRSACKCPKCGGDLIEIRPKKRGGKTFYGCSNYNNERSSATSSSGRSPSPSRARCARRRSSSTADEGQADDRVRQQGVRVQALALLGEDEVRGDLAPKKTPGVATHAAHLATP